jgi:hypothetical protein
MLQHLKTKGKGVFFATNSYFEFADIIMRSTIGEDYLDYFDLAIYYSKKPEFFNPTCTADAYFLDLSRDDQLRQPGFKSEALESEETYRKLVQDKVLIQGSYKHVEAFYSQFKGENLNYLFVGDNFYADCDESANLPNWDSVVVSDHISTGFIGSQPQDFKQMWAVEHSLGIHGHQQHSMFLTKHYREKALFSISNVDTFKHL